VRAQADLATHDQEAPHAHHGGSGIAPAASRLPHRACRSEAIPRWLVRTCHRPARAGVCQVRRRRRGKRGAEWR